MTEQVHRAIPQPMQHDGAGNALRPMSGRLMTRLFAVPALIVTVVITCAVLVTLLFGWIGAGQQEDIPYLIDKLAAGTGEKVAGFMLLPRDKELWQAAQELANRLQSPEKEKIDAAQKSQIAHRLNDILARTVLQRPFSDATLGRITYMAIALGRLGDASSIEQFEQMLSSDDKSVREAGLKGMAWMGPTAEMKQRAATLAPIARDDPSPEVRLLAAATLGQVGSPDDERVIAALKDQLIGDNEVRWNAALALMRLGDLSGKDDVIEMLNRGYWQKQQIRPDPDSDLKRSITEGEMSRNIRSALDALGNVRDPDLRTAVDALTNDKNLDIVKAAKETLAKMSSAGAATAAERAAKTADEKGNHADQR